MRAALSCTLYTCRTSSGRGPKEPRKERGSCSAFDARTSTAVKRTPARVPSDSLAAVPVFGTGCGRAPCATQGLCRASPQRLSARGPGSGTHVRDTRLEHTSATYVRCTRQGHMPATYVWNIRLEHTSGTHVRDTRLGRTSGTYVWNIRQGHSPCVALP